MCLQRGGTSVFDDRPQNVPRTSTPEGVTPTPTFGFAAGAFSVLLLPLVALHITVNALYALVKKEPLIKAMITGKKPAAPYADAQGAGIAARPSLRAMACLALAAVIVLGGIVALGGRLAL